MRVVRGTIGRPLTALVVALTTGVGCSQSSDRPEVAAVVEGIEVISADIEALAETYLQRPTADLQRTALSSDQVTKVVLEYQIKLALLEHAAKTMGIADEAQSDLGAAAGLMQPEAYALIGERPEDFVGELRAGRLSKAVAEKLFPTVSPSEAALRQEYDRMAPLLDRRWKATVAVARFATQASVQDLRARVKGGETFEQAASALGAQGVGTVDVNPLVAPLGPAVLDVIGKLPAGEMSEAVPVDNEYLAILVKDRQDLPELSFEDLRPELAHMIAERERFQRFHRWFDEQLADAHISVDPYYGKWDKKFTSVT